MHSPHPPYKREYARNQPQSQHQHSAQPSGTDGTSSTYNQRPEERHRDTEGADQQLKRVLPRPHHVALKSRPGPNLIHAPAPTQCPIMKVRHRPKCARYHCSGQAARQRLGATRSDLSGQVTRLTALGNPPVHDPATTRLQLPPRCQAEEGIPETNRRLATRESDCRTTIGIAPN